MFLTPIRTFTYKTNKAIKRIRYENSRVNKHFFYKIVNKIKEKKIDSAKYIVNNSTKSIIDCH